MRTIAGVFPSMPEARSAATDLKRLGIADEEIIMAAGGDLEKLITTQRNISAAAASGWGWLFAGFIPQVIRQDTARASGALGAAVGFGVGVILGIVFRAIPMSLVAGVNPLLVVAITGSILAFGGGLAAYVYGLGISHEATAVCAEAEREHGIAVAVHVGENVETRAAEVMRGHHAALLRSDDDPFRATGWTGLRVDAHRYPSDSGIRSFQAQA